MDVRTTIIEHTPILTPKGRLDGYGSGVVEDALKDIYDRFHQVCGV